MLRSELREMVDRATRLCLGVRVRLLNRVVSGVFDEALRAEGLRVGQFNILMALGAMSPVSPARLAEVLHMDASTMSRDLAHLRKRGWIEATSLAGTRGQTLTLTSAGEEILARAMPAWEQAQGDVSSQLGPEAVAAFRAAARNQGFPPSA